MPFAGRRARCPAGAVRFDMARVSPVQAAVHAPEALVGVYGPPEAGVRVMQAYEPLDLEYAAVRKACGLIDLPQRATLEVAGADRGEFLNRMLTQELKGVPPLSSRRSFWLSRTGRIDGDLRVLVMEERVLIDVDVHAAARVKATLDAYVIAEDVRITDRTEECHRLALHGPGARAALERCGERMRGVNAGEMAPGQVSVVRVAGAEVIVDRDDSAGEIGLELLADARHAARVHAEVLGAGGWRWGRVRGGGETVPQVRPIGWGAYNVARVEAGTPVYFLDFGPNNLPHETGVLGSRVSFTKGCYLGQEIVARMHNLGQPKKRLVALTLGRETDGSVPGAEAAAEPGDADAAVVPQPSTGAQVFGAGVGERGEPVGAVTSSVVSPMLGGVAVCFAMVRSVSAAPGTRLLVECEGAMLPATVREGLAFWTRGAGGPNRQTAGPAAG